MAKVMIAVSNVTLHVEDPDNHVPFEYGIDGKIIQGGLAAKAVPPWTPVELDAEEAERILARCNGTRIPAGVADPRRWLYDHGRELGIPAREMEALAHG